MSIKRKIANIVLITAMFIAVTGISLSSQAFAGVITNPSIPGSSYTSLEAALTAASAGQTLLCEGYFDHKVYNWPNSTLTNITIKASTETSVATFDCSSSQRFLYIPYTINLSLEGLTVQNCQIPDDGAAIQLSAANSKLWLRNDIFKNCYASGTTFNGGVVWSSATSDLIYAYNCIFYKNSSGKWGGVAYSGTWTAINCTFYGNSALTAGGVSYGTTWTKLTNCILYDNSATASPVFSAPPSSIRYSDIQNNSYYTGTGNISAEPNFLSTVEGNSNFLRLAPGSLCIDSGTVEADVLTKDLANFPRPHAGKADMGVYESKGPYINITYPNGDEMLSAESTVNVTWQSTDEYGIGYNVTIRFSSNEGQSWTILTNTEPNDGSYSWPVPAFPSESCLISIEARNGSGEYNSDVSTRAFNIYRPIIYVATTGNDVTGTGKYASPLKTIYKGLHSVMPTGEVRLLPGSYTAAAPDYMIRSMILWPKKNNITLKLSPEATGIATIDAQFLGRVISLESVVNLTVEGITIKNGRATAEGGGAFYLPGTSALWLKNVIVKYCTAEGTSVNGGVVYGAGAYDVYASNSIFHDNRGYAGGVGGGFSGNWDVVNCTFYNNKAVSYAIAYTATWTILNSVFNNNSPTASYFYAAPSIPRYSCFQPGAFYAGTGNTSAEPRFISTNETSASFLKPDKGSPCIDFGTVEAKVPTRDITGFPRPHATYADMGAYESKGPFIRVTYPNGGELLTAESTVNITWQSTDEYGIPGNITIRYSSNEGQSWLPVATPPNAVNGSYAWTVPAFPSESCLISIEASNGSGESNCDASNGIFNIYRRVIYISPTGSDTTGRGTYPLPLKTVYKGLHGVFPTGEVHMLPGTYTIEAGDYLNDSMISWPNKVNITLKLSPEATQPATIDARYLGRAISVEGSVNLTIEGITITRGYVAGGLDGGGIFLPISSKLWLDKVIIKNCSAEGLSTSLGGGVYCNSTNVYVNAKNSVFYNNKAYNGGAFYQGIWNIYNCAFINNKATTYSVAAGNSWTTGAAFVNSIVWYNDPTPYYLLSSPYAYFRNNDLQPNGFPNNGLLTYNISAEPMFISTSESDSGFLMLAQGSPCIDFGSSESGVASEDISGYTRPHGRTYDMGVYEFKGPSVLVTYPNGGQLFNPGDPVTITWQSSDEGGILAGSVTIEYSTDDGSSWTGIVANTSDTGTYPWTAPSNASAQYRVRVRLTSNSLISNYDMSDTAFTVQAPYVYVAPWGSDTYPAGDGTYASPYKTIQKGVDSVIASGEVRLLPGLHTTDAYSVNSMVKWPNKQNITLKLSPEATGVATVDARSLGRMISLEAAVNLTIEGITLNNGLVSATGGGAVYLPSGSKMWLKDVVIKNSSASGSIYGGAVYGASATIYADNCVFFKNSASNGGVAYSGTWFARNCNFIANTSTSGNYSISYLTTWSKLLNSIIWNNGGNNIIYYAPTTIMKYCDAQPGAWINATGNISIEPRLISTDEASAGFMELAFNSPCLDKASSEAPVKDIAGKTRPHGFANDMGVYEFQGPSVSIEAPNLNQKLTAGSIYNVIWSISGEVTGTALVKLTTNEGATWDTLISTETPATAGMHKTFPWTVPSFITNECYISVEVWGNGIWSTDISNSSFEITTVVDTREPLVTVEAPNGGETYYTGQTVDIQWTAIDDLGFPPGPINIYLSTNGGSSWDQIATGEANTSPYSWTVPSISTSTNCFISVEATDTFAKVGVDRSNSSFTINQLINFYISPEGNDSTGVGTPAKPFKTLQYALSVVDPGGQVRAMPGVYTGAGNYNVQWPVKDNITLISTFDVNGITRPVTFDAQHLGRFVRFQGTVQLTVEGITIMNGYAMSGINPYGAAFYMYDNSELWVKNVIIKTCTNDAGVGAVFYSPTFTSTLHADSCDFSNNIGGDAPGTITAYLTVYMNNCMVADNVNSNYFGLFYQSDLTAADCIFRNNIAAGSAIMSGGYCYVQNCTFEGNTNRGLSTPGNFNNLTMEATNCTFSNNYSGLGGVVQGCFAKFNRCIFKDNVANQGGVFHSTSGVLEIEDSIFLRNRATVEGGVFFSGTFTATNCVFAKNSAQFGGISRFTSGTYVNCTAYSNTAEAPNPGAVDGGSNGGINNIFFYNSLPVFSGGAATSLMYSDVEWSSSNWPGGSGTNISSEPQFISTNEADTANFLRLRSTSPCLDTGTPEGAPAFDIVGTSRPQGTYPDMGAYEMAPETNAPTIESIFINRARFISGDIISSKISLMQVRLIDINGVATIELYIDGTTEAVLFDLYSGDLMQGEWRAVNFSIPTGNQQVNTHTLHFYVRDSSGNSAEYNLLAVIIKGEVQLIGRPMNYPNPFKPLSSDPGARTTSIQYTLSSDAPVTLIIYDITGKEVKKIHSGSGGEGGRAGINNVQWDGRNVFSEVSGNGMYIYKIISGNKVIGSGKVVIFD